MRLHFHFADATRRFVDAAGAEFDDLAAAREEARLSARELLSLDHGRPDPNYAGGRYEITNAAGGILAVVLFDDMPLG